MYNLILENKSGDQLTFNQNSPFTVTDIEGLNPPDATINTSAIALMDGAKYNSAKVDMRTINIAFAIEYQAARNRVEVYRVLKSKQYIKLYYKGDYRNVFIEGYIQSISIDYGAMKQIVTCTILCPSPYFKQAQEMVDELLNIVGAFHFPFASTSTPEILFGYISNEIGITIENDGDVDCGMVIELYAYTAVSNPKIFNYLTQEYIGLDFDMQAADLIRIDTRQGEKDAVLIRSGVESSVFNYIMEGSTWLQLPAEGGTFVYELGSGDLGDLAVTFRHYDLYEGV